MACGRWAASFLTLSSSAARSSSSTTRLSFSSCQTSKTSGSGVSFGWFGAAFGWRKTQNCATSVRSIGRRLRVWKQKTISFCRTRRSTNALTYAQKIRTGLGYAPRWMLHYTPERRRNRIYAGTWIAVRKVGVPINVFFLNLEDILHLTWLVCDHWLMLLCIMM